MGKKMELHANGLMTLLFGHIKHVNPKIKVPNLNLK